VAMPQLINVLVAAIYSVRICGEVKLSLWERMMKKARTLQVIMQRGDIGKIYVDCNWLRRPAWDLLLGHVGYVNLVAGVRVTSSGMWLRLSASYKNRRCVLGSKNGGEKVNRLYASQHGLAKVR
jgi:hypothetical protein